MNTIKEAGFSVLMFSLIMITAYILVTTCLI
jgi:hypothetical protein